MPTLDDLLSSLQAALCKVNVSCGNLPDPSACQATMIADGTDYQTVKVDIAAGKVRYDAAEAARCIQSFDALAQLYASGCTQSMRAGGPPPPSDCSRTFTGTVPNGGACFNSFQCSSQRCMAADATCAPSHQCCAGTCSPPQTILPAGADCVASSRDQICATGTVCAANPPSAPAKCMTPSTVEGSPCSALGACAPPLFCQLDSSDGTCRRVAARGAPCVASGISAPQACDDLLDYCDRSTHVCTRRGAPGEPCDPAQRTCLGYAQCLGSTCVALGSERAACEPTSGPGCLGDLECSPITKTCTLPTPASACP